VATDVTPELPAKATAPTRRRRLARAVRRPYGRRFVLVYVVLALAVAGAIVAAVLVPTTLKPAPRVSLARWSSWQPEGATPSPAAQVAVQTAKSYLLPSGNEFVHITTSPPQWQDAPVREVVVLNELGGEIQITPTSDADTIMYSLCGPERDCTIPSSNASARGILVVLQRESLELALYSLKYIRGTQNVIVLLPNGVGPGPTLLFWRRRDLAGMLHRPLARTLPPYRRGFIHVTQRDADVTEQLATPHLMTAEIQKNADGTALFVVKRLPVG
jgi:hypothetical protein